MGWNDFKAGIWQDLPQDTLAELKIRRGVEVDRFRKNLLRQHTVTFKGKEWQMSDNSQWRLPGIVMSALTSKIDPVNYPWPETKMIAADNSQVSMTVEDVLQLNKLIQARYSTALLHARDLKDQINALTSKRAINAFDITAGWPVTVPNGA